MGAAGHFGRVSGVLPAELHAVTAERVYSASPHAVRARFSVVATISVVLHLRSATDRGRAVDRASIMRDGEETRRRMPDMPVRFGFIPSTCPF